MGAVTKARAVPGSLEKDLEEVLFKHKVGAESNTKDFILAEYLLACLDAFNRATSERAAWIRGNT